MTAAAIVLLAAAPAGAATTIGSDLASAPTATLGCTGGCTFSQRSIPGRQVTAPTDGVIVRWRIRVGSSSTAQLVKLRVIRGTGAASMGVGSSQGEPVPAAAGIYTFDTRLPVIAGDFIGIDCCVNPAGGTFVNTSAGASDRWDPPLGDGETRAPSTDDYEIMVNADIEPDCDSDGFGDETQDPNLFGGGCPPKGRTLTLDTNKSKLRKGKKVLLSGELNAAENDPACEAGQTVELQRKRPSQADFQTFKVVLTTAGGSFSTKKRVKKTFEYRALVGQSAACAEVTSDTEKVKVKKRR